MDSMSFVLITGESQSSCGYCHNKASETSRAFGLWAYTLSAQAYQMLIDCGWRRSGQYLYRPDIPQTCCKPYTIRLAVSDFQCSKGQKKVLRKMRKYLDGTAAVHTQPASKPLTVMDSVGEKLQQPSFHIPTIVTHQSIPSNSAASETVNVSIAKSVTPLMRHQPIIDLIHATEHPLKSHQPHSLDISLAPAEFDQEVFELYRKYQIEIHHDEPDHVDKKNFVRFLVDSPIQHRAIPTVSIDDLDESTRMVRLRGFGSYYYRYRLDDKLVAVGVLDILPNCVSSVYFMYDPSYSYLSLGNYSALREIALTATLSKTLPSIKYYYMGYYIHSCVKMRYKAGYKPSELLCPETYRWADLASVVSFLDKRPDTAFFNPVSTADSYSVAEEPRAIVTLSPEDMPNDILQNLIIYHNDKPARLKDVNLNKKQIYSFKQLFTKINPDLFNSLVFVPT